VDITSFPELKLQDLIKALRSGTKKYYREHVKTVVITLPPRLGILLTDFTAEVATESLSLDEASTSFSGRTRIEKFR
jgi:hypothetical protein